MSLTLALAIGSSLITAKGYSDAARGAKMEGALTARNIKTQAKIRKLQALQEHNSIMENLQSEESGKYTCDRYNQGYAERSVLEMLKYRIDLLLKLTADQK